MSRDQAIGINNAAGMIVLEVREYVRRRTGIHLTSAGQDVSMLPTEMQMLVESVEKHRAEIARQLGEILKS